MVRIGITRDTAVNSIQRFIEKWKEDQRKRICSGVLTGFDRKKNFGYSLSLHCIVIAIPLFDISLE
jgi:hypothetical protein